MSDRTYSFCDLICLYAVKTTTRYLHCAVSLVLAGGSSFACLVYDVAIRWVCHAEASSALQSPLMEEAIEIAADNPPVNAKWTPVEKNGSINA
jgi:hypothetical protein